MPPAGGGVDVMAMWSDVECDMEIISPRNELY